MMMQTLCPQFRSGRLRGTWVPFSAGYSASGEPILAVPIQSVATVFFRTLNGEKRLSVVKKSGENSEQVVELGLSDGKMVEIKSGLKEGDEILWPRIHSEEK
jgi:multidrug efflux pump subunit AcrA (membrane-fusion protein)